MITNHRDGNVDEMLEVAMIVSYGNVSWSNVIITLHCNVTGKGTVDRTNKVYKPHSLAV